MSCAPPGAHRKNGHFLITGGVHFLKSQLLNFRQCFFELNSKQNTGKGHGNDVGNGFCHIDAGGRVGYHMRHQIDERKQQDKFPDDGHDDGIDGFSKRGKGHLAGNLDAEESQTSEVNAKCRCGKGNQIGVRSKDADKDLGNQLHGNPQEKGIGQAGTQQQVEGLFHTVCIFRTVIITGNRLRALGNSLKWKHGKLHDTGQDRHGSDCNIAAVAKQGGVEADSNDTFACLHDKGSKAQENTGQNGCRFQPQILDTDMKLGFLAAEKADDPYTGNGLGKYRCEGGSLYAHMESEDKYRIQDDVTDGADQDGDHGNGCKSLGGDKSIHTERQLHEQGSECVNLHVSGCIADSVGTCAKGQQQRLVKSKKNDGQNTGNDNLQGKAVA